MPYMPPVPGTENRLAQLLQLVGSAPPYVPPEVMDRMTNRSQSELLMRRPGVPDWEQPGWTNTWQSRPYSERGTEPPVGFLGKYPAAPDMPEGYAVPEHYAYTQPIPPPWAGLGLPETEPLRQEEVVTTPEGMRAHRARQAAEEGKVFADYFQMPKTHADIGLTAPSWAEVHGMPSWLWQQP